MEDLVIDGKKYPSSKRAAELTGYAKDYIGQLCREGRVEAKLVGRSWYVLDSSITEHRFGKEEAKEPEIPAQVAQEEEPESPWESPKYISEEVAPLPELTARPKLRSTINLLATPSSIKASDIPNIQAAKEEEPLMIESHPEPVRDEIVERPVGEVSVELHRIPTAKVEEPEVSASNTREVAKVAQEMRREPSRRPRKRRKSLMPTAITIAVAIISITIMILGTGILENKLTIGENSSILNFLGGKSFYSK